MIRGRVPMRVGWVDYVLRSVVVLVGVTVSAWLIYRGNTYTDPTRHFSLLMPAMCVLTALAVIPTSIGVAMRITWASLLGDEDTATTLNRVRHNVR